MRDVDEVRGHLRALTERAHGASVTIGVAGEGGRVVVEEHPLFGKLVAWAVNYCLDVIDGCEIGSGPEDLDAALTWIVDGALGDAASGERDGR